MKESNMAFTTRRTLNFCPKNNYTVAATTSSSNTVVANGTLNEGSQYTDICISNNTAGVAYIKWGTTSQTAVVGGLTSFPILAGETVTLNTGLAVTNVGVILAGGTASGNVFITLGVGA